jgi:hypothetical protein
VAQQLGVGIVAYSPLGRGFLTGQITSADDLDPDDVRRSHPRFGAEALEHNLQLVARVRAIADELDVTPASWRWPGCCIRATTWCRFPAPAVSNAWRRTPPPPRSS